jgi:hypothetical protein
MKYFRNYPYTAESLKAEFRALCLTMHPDKGGNADEFKAMSAEYSDILATLTNGNGTTAAKARTAANDDSEAAQDFADMMERPRPLAPRHPPPLLLAALLPWLPPAHLPPPWHPWPLL